MSWRYNTAGLSLVRLAKTIALPGNNESKVNNCVHIGFTGAEKKRTYKENKPSIL